MKKFFLLPLLAFVLHSTSYTQFPIPAGGSNLKDCPRTMITEYRSEDGSSWIINKKSPQRYAGEQLRKQVDDFQGPHFETSRLQSITKTYDEKGNEHSSQSSYLSGAISGFEEEKLDGKDGYAKGSAVIHTKQDRDSIVVTRKYRIWVDLNENGNEHAKLIQDWDKRNNEFVDNSRIETHYNAE